MATKSVLINNTAYTLLDTSADSAVWAQNVSNSEVRIVFSATLPAVTSTAFGKLYPGQAILREGVTGNMYALSVDASAAAITVAE